MNAKWITRVAATIVAALMLCGLHAEPVRSYQPEVGKNYQATTSATGSNWVQLTDRICDRVIILSSLKTGTATAIEIRQGSSDSFGIVIPANSAVTVRGLPTRNSNELWIRRADESNTQVTITYRTEIGGF